MKTCMFSYYNTWLILDEDEDGDNTLTKSDDENNDNEDTLKNDDSKFSKDVQE